MAKKTKLDKVMEVSIRRGFVFPTAEIYGGFAGVYDFGPIGSLLKEKLLKLWTDMFVKSEIDPPVFMVDGAVVLPFPVLKASGHVDHFVDPVVECKDCKEEVRADHLIEEETGQFVEGLDEMELTKIIRDDSINCPSCGGELADVKVFNLMLGTHVGSKRSIAYMRPETAQIMFLDFKRTATSMRQKLPFGIAQIGKSMRNEVSPRKGLIRLREFGQMEIEMFVNPDRINEHPGFEEKENIKLRLLTREEQKKEDTKILEIIAKEAYEKEILPNKFMAYYLALETLFYTKVGIPWEKFRFRHMLPEETPHYSGGNWDLEIELEGGVIEIVGNAYRRDYDLGNHGKHSGVDLSIEDNGKRLIAHVVEPSFGVERSIYCVLEHCFRDKGYDRDWVWFQFPRAIAPIDVEVYPLMKKDGLDTYAWEMYKELKISGFNVLYDDRGSIGRRYARADEIGCPFCITCDYETLREDTVTIRDRDTMNQIRVKAKEVIDILGKLFKEEIKFEEAGELIS